MRQEDAVPSDLKGKGVVVIDVIRATSSITMALASGAREALCFATVREVFQARKRLSGGHLLLCGERNCHKVQGFDLGNSPGDFSPERCVGRTLLISTTNGTRALKLTHQAEPVVLGAFSNLSAVAEYLACAKGDVILLCAGTEGRRSEDDVACAGGIAAKLVDDFGLSAAAREAVGSWRRMLRAPIKFLRATEGGRPLLPLGLERDIRDVARRDWTDVVPLVTRYGDGCHVVPLPGPATVSLGRG